MSSMGTGDSDTTTTFPRIELPPVPTFGGTVEPLRDEPVATWQPPVAPPLSSEQRYRSMVERVATLATPVPTQETPAHPPAQEALAPAPAPSIEPVATPQSSVPVMPELAPAPESTPLPASRIAIALMVVAVAFLAWASRMAFSPGLLGLAALLLAQLAAAASSSPRGRSLALRAAIPAIVVALLAAMQAIGNLTSGMAMVAGLFVLVAALPTLIVFVAVQVVLRRRGDRIGPADTALRDSWKLRAGTLAALLVAALLVRDSFSAKPDAIVALGIVALVAITLHSALRDRTTSAD